MSNESLDIWIFQRQQELTLGWQSRRNIILDIAKGLTYLHEECRQKIFHLDIKSQNILLDEDFNEKMSDFGFFGVVVLEILCERKNLDRSQLKEDMHLLDLFKRKAEEEQLLDIIDKYNDVMQTHRAEVVEMMMVAVWCLQSDFSRKPSVSVVIKVLKGSVDIQINLDYNFTTPVAPRPITVAGHQGDAIGAVASLFASALSRPRQIKQTPTSKLKLII
ncbi:probable receptor-like protein kinase At5g20050 [Camellia sinensis]|uniref:probable receptor-like protein kinase At5g20050 n=1 Tax=Camellia sinensis TaxID=4442 RepID=UPI001036CA0F|nr:probable receptor-like protein kinase At5g20050 [Camellia sinensis]